MSSKSIWFNSALTIETVGETIPKTLSHYLEMKWVEIGTDFMSMSMPVDERTHQPYGLLHGGASCALAETVGSVASHFVVDSSKYFCVGLEINANHLKSVQSGIVIATAKPLHLGKTTHVWDIRITDEDKNLVCVSRLTVAIRKIF